MTRRTIAATAYCVLRTALSSSILLYIVRLNLGNIRDLSSFLTITDIQEAGDFYTWEYLRDNLERVLRQIEPNFEDDINDDEGEDPFEDLSRWL